MRGKQIYRALMLLYPKPFRTHFGGEMLRLFEDCCPEKQSARFWIETLQDFAVSIPREWRREIHREESSIDYTGLADAIMCSIVVGTLLLGWGWMGARFARELGAPESGAAFAFATVATAVLVGVLGKFAAARSGVIDTSCSQLIDYERTTVR